MAADKATPHLLVIDDCTLTCHLLTALLTAEGYRVTTAYDGTSGLAAARHHSYDLAIVDLHLPDLSGIEVAGLLQPEVPFLALTIDRSPAAVQACIDQGALSYLVKPLTPIPSCAKSRWRWNGAGSSATCAAPCETITSLTRRWAC